MICPVCDGRGGHFGIGCGAKAMLGTVPCEECHGAGTVTEERGGQLEVGRVEGQRLRADRKARGLSLREEAKRLGVSPLELSRRERGL